MDNSKIAHHISENFNKELEDIRNKVLTMGGLVEQQIEQAIIALTSGDIDAECTQIIALRQPAAFDLRLLLVVLRIINELERIGDLAERIAKVAIQLSTTNEGRTDEYHELKHMAGLVKDMLHASLDNFARMSVDGITQITGSDAAVDREYASIIRQLITQMMEDPRNITRMLDMLWTVRALERIGDHSRYICEHLIYMVKGEDVRHLSQAQLERIMSQ
jgi:phosphate transport system protein